MPDLDEDIQPQIHVRIAVAGVAWRQRIVIAWHLLHAAWVLAVGSCPAVAMSIEGQPADGLNA